MVKQGQKGSNLEGADIWRRYCHYQLGTQNVRSGVVHHLATSKDESG